MGPCGLNGSYELRAKVSLLVFTRWMNFEISISRNRAQDAEALPLNSTMDPESLCKPNAHQRGNRPNGVIFSIEISRFVSLGAAIFCWSCQFAQWKLVKTFNLAICMRGVWCVCFSMPILCSITDFTRNDFVIILVAVTRVRICGCRSVCVGCWSREPYAVAWIKLTTLFCGGTFCHTCFIVGGMSSWFSIITLIGPVLSMERQQHTTIYLWILVRFARAELSFFISLLVATAQRTKEHFEKLTEKMKTNAREDEVDEMRESSMGLR